MLMPAFLVSVRLPRPTALAAPQYAPLLGHRRESTIQLPNTSTHRALNSQLTGGFRKERLNKLATWRALGRSLISSPEHSADTAR